jgi:hypothetical protein
MDITDLSNIFLVSLWKSNVEEVVNNKHYYFTKEVTKIALKLVNEDLSQAEEDLLQLHDWLVIEVESSLMDAKAEELESYLRSHFDEIGRNINELEIISPQEEDDEYADDKKIDDDSLDSFLNSL